MSIGNLLLLLVFFIAGEYLHHVMSIPMSGPLLGMALLFVFLVARGGPSRGLEDTARSLLASLALFFVPAAIGIVEHLDVLGRHWLPILVATVGGAAISLLVAAGTFVTVARLMQRRPLCDPAQGGSNPGLALGSIARSAEEQSG